MSSLFRPVTALAAFVVLAAACGGGTEQAADTEGPAAVTEAPAPTPAATDAASTGGAETPTPAGTDSAATTAPTAAADVRLPELTPMPMANVPYFGPEYIAVDQGFDTAYNLDFEIVQASALGVPGVQAAVAGQVDTFQSVAFDSWFKSFEAGADLVGVISGQLSGGDFDVYRYYVRSDAGIEGPEDLQGLTMGIAGVGSYGDVPMDLWLQDAGVDPAAVESIAVPVSEIPAALINGQIDIAAAFSTVYSTLEANHADEVQLLFRDSEVLPVDEFATAYGFTREFIETNPDRVAAYIAAMQDSVAFIQENPEEARAIIAEVTASPIEGLIVPAYPDGLCMDLSHLEPYQEILVDLGYLQQPIPNLADHFTNEYNPACS